jgi:hypothetical protein
MLHAAKSLSRSLQSMLRLRFVLLVGIWALTAQSGFAQLGAPPIPPPDYMQGTQSVLVMRFDDEQPAANQTATKQTAAAKPVRMNDKNVQPATANQPLDPTSGNRPAGDGPDASSAANAMAAADLLSHALEAPKEAALPGTPISLLQAIGPLGSNRGGQLAVTHAYWKLSAAQADYNWAIEEADELDKVSAGSAAVERTEMATAHASTQARVLEAKLSAVTAQQELADLLGMSPSNPLPLAADAPLVGAYRTYFEAIYAGRLPPPRMRLIDRTLPLRREAIETHVATVQAAASAVHTADEAHAKSQTDIYNLLYCEAELSRQRRSFLVAVRDYNLDIAEYALTVAEPNVPVERVIGMLIRVKQPTTAPSSTAPSSAAPSGAAAASAGAFARPSPDNPLMQPAVPRGSAPAAAGSAAPQWSGVGGASSPANPSSSSTAAPPTNPIAPPGSAGPLGNSSPPTNTVPPTSIGSPGSTAPPANTVSPGSTVPPASQFPPSTPFSSGTPASPTTPIFTTPSDAAPPSTVPSTGGAVVTPNQNAPEIGAPNK